MALTKNYFGFSLYEHKGGKPNYPVTRYPLTTADGGINFSFGQGDLVSVSPTAGSSGLQNYNVGVQWPNTAGLVVGTFDSVTYTTKQGVVVTAPYWAADTPTFNDIPPMVTVNDLPYSVFKVQCNAPLPAYGAYFSNVNAGGSDDPNPATGQSRMYLDVVNIIADNLITGTCKIIGLAPSDGSDGPNNWTDPYPIVLAMITSHVYHAPTPSAGN